MSTDYFHLTNLPLDLVECISEFFTAAEAARTLTVSSSFHSLFARTVWREINYAAFRHASNNPTCSDAFTHYGHHVRSIRLKRHWSKLEYDFSGLSDYFPNTTSLTFGTRYSDDPLDPTLKCISEIAKLPALRSLRVNIYLTRHVECLKMLAEALLSRNAQHHDWQHIVRLDLGWWIPSGGCPWTAMCDFIEKIGPLQISDMRISAHTRCSVTPPTHQQVWTLRPYLINFPKLTSENSNGSTCVAHRNRQYFSQSGSSNRNGDLTVFPITRSMKLLACCATFDIYDYFDFGPTKFPSLQHLAFDTLNCGERELTMEMGSSRAVLLQHWPNLSYFELGGAITPSTLCQMLDLNSQIARLEIYGYAQLANEDGRFKLELVLTRLPVLTSLTLSLDDDLAIDTDLPASIRSNMDNYSHIVQDSLLKTLYIESTTVSAHTMELLHMLPKLKEVTIRYCAVEDGDATLDVLNRISSDISDKLYKRAIELYYFDYLDDREGWTAELFIAMAAAAPKLKSLVIDHPQYEIADPVWLVYPKIVSWYDSTFSEPYDDNDDDDYTS